MIRHLLLTVAAVLLTLWTYQSVHSAEWVYEDRATLTAAKAGGWSRALTNWTWQFTHTPARAHALSLGLHLVIGALLGLMARRLGLTAFGAWIVALIWLVWPIPSETVAYAKARSEQIVLIGVLIAALGATARWWRPAGAAWLLFGSLIAIGGEPSGVTVLLLAPLVAWHTWHRASTPVPWWTVAAVSGGLIVAGVLWYGGVRAVINADGEAGIASAADVTWVEWGLAQSGAVWYWLLATVWPALVTPDVDVDRLSMGVRLFGMFAMAVAGGVAWRCRQTRPMVTLALLWSLCALLPRVLVQTPRSYLSAQQVAMAFIGLGLLAGYWTEQWKARWTHS